MNADDGFRPGTKEDQRLGNEWQYMKGTHSKYAAVRADPDKYDAIMSRLRAMEDKLSRALDLTRLMIVLFAGGHVRKDKLARLQDKGDPKADPEKIMDALKAQTEAK